MAKPVLIVDADPDCYRAAYAGERWTEWDTDNKSCDLDFDLSKAYLLEKIAWYRNRFKPSDIFFCLSDHDGNWRKDICSTYKANRKSFVRPQMLDQCEEFLRQEFGAESWKNLEADDMAGLQAVSLPNAIIVSIDKDMQGIPVKVFRPGKDTKPRKISWQQACYWHMMQTLMGDATDGYPGCPGIGEKKAEKKLLPILEKFSRRKGVNTGQMYEEAWFEVVLPLFKEKGITAGGALVQARLAYILRERQDYEPDTGRVRLWNPM